jgi:predicted TIM-barrel fold metal-dependent hydrolase
VGRKDATDARETTLPTIDADAHVIETEATWAYMEGADLLHRPVAVSTPVGEQEEGRPQPQTEYWAIDGTLHARDRNIGLDTAVEAREMRDIDRRLAHMAEIEIDVQVLFPSVFLRPISRNPSVELAINRSYNRWLADIWEKGGGRLRWVAMAPVLSLDDPGLVRAELTAAKETGACGIFMCGLAADRECWDPYFFPLYEIAQELDLAICYHAGNDSVAMHDFFVNGDGLSKFKFPVISAFHSLILREIPARFPTLSWGFIEAGAGWIPYVLSELALRLRRRGRRVPEAPLAEYNMYVACQVNEDLAYLAGVAGEDHLVIGTDYGHHDTSTEIEAIRLLKTQNKVPPGTVDKILGPNAAALYGLA